MSSPSRRFKDAAYAQLARVGKAVSSPKRLELLDLLAQAPRTVEALAHEAGLSIASTSQHLQALRSARLVRFTKQGLYVQYRLADDDVARFFVALRELAHDHLPELEQARRDFFGEPTDEGEPHDPAQLMRKVHAGQITLLDVRPAPEYEAGHLPGALGIPLHELDERWPNLPPERPIVAYCRGPYCVMAAQAVQLLREHGFDAHRVELDVSTWKARHAEARP